MASHRRPSHRLANRCARSDRPIRVRAQPGIQAVWVEQISRGFRRGAVFYRQTVVPVHHTGLPPGGRAHFPLVTLPKSLSLSCPQTRLGVISEQANMRSARCAGLSTLTAGRRIEIAHGEASVHAVCFSSDGTNLGSGRMPSHCGPRLESVRRHWPRSVWIDPDFIPRYPHPFPTIHALNVDRQGLAGSRLLPIRDRPVRVWTHFVHRTGVSNHLK